MNKYLLGLFVLFLTLSIKVQAQYFPPLSNSASWETVSPGSLGWSASRIDTLYKFLENENSKAFIVLKDGKIVLEKYFGTFTPDSVWYWASAGKTISSFLVGKAQEEKYLKQTDLSSKYLGIGWTNCTLAQENAITVQHQLTMTTGLNDNVTDNHCTSAACLQYLAPSGTRWAYHNAPYTLLEKVLENATAININQYTQTKLKSKTGMTGAWFMSGYDNVYFSTARSMARFGLLMQNKCVWNGDSLLRDTVYVNSMFRTSEQYNKSYGYLWWLNGKASYMLPTVQFVFPGWYAPDAPVDMFAGLGKNGQIVSVSPSQGLVVVRMGNAPGSSSSEVPNQFCNLIWEKLNAAIFNRTGIDEVVSADLQVYPIPATDQITIRFAGKVNEVCIYTINGSVLLRISNPTSPLKVAIRNFQPGIYLLKLSFDNSFRKLMFLKR